MSRTRDIALCALFAGITAALSQAAIPLGPVPINLGTLAVFAAGTFLGARRAAVSLALYAALGALGLPVFAMMRGGLAVLAGPTGGYIVGYIPAAFWVGWVVERIRRNARGAGGGQAEPERPFALKQRGGRFAEAVRFMPAMLAGMAVYFTLGSAWFMFSSGTPLWETLTVCVLPFIPGDLLKAAAVCALAVRYRVNGRARSPSPPA